MKDPKKYAAKNVQKGAEVDWRRLLKHNGVQMAEAKQLEVDQWLGQKVCAKAIGFGFQSHRRAQHCQNKSSHSITWHAGPRSGQVADISSNSVSEREDASAEPRHSQNMEGAESRYQVSASSSD